jgi:hypothetical protein
MYIGWIRKNIDTEIHCCIHARLLLEEKRASVGFRFPQQVAWCPWLISGGWVIPGNALLSWTGRVAGLSGGVKSKSRSADNREGIDSPPEQLI